MGVQQQQEAAAIKRLVIVSNRLPVVMSREDDGQWNVRPGQGGLVTALAPVLRDRGGLWIGWAGTSEGEAIEAVWALQHDGIGYTLEPVPLSDEEVAKFYHGFSNEILWPLFHDLPDRCNFDPDYWRVYRQVNRKYVETIALTTREDDYIWVQDYHLLLVADEMRQLGLQRKVGYFLHIPFPPLDLFMKLPWRFQLLNALMAYDLVGFQTVRDLRNFINCVRTLVPEVQVAGKRLAATLTTRERSLRLGAFPIGIDHKKFLREARSKAVADRAWDIHERLPERKLILGVDRLDYSKGIPQRIMAFARALEQFPELRGKVTFIQVVVPSRMDVPEYAELQKEIERLVGHVNGLFTESGWTPIHYIFRPLDPVDLVAYYRTAEVALVTPLKDGMNLVAKEYCTCSFEDGVLILSEFAGAAAQLQQGALLVNPHDIQGVAEAIQQAVTMPDSERRSRMKQLRRAVSRQNVFWWVDSFLRAAISRGLDQFPQVDYFVPQDPTEPQQEPSPVPWG